MTEKYYYIGSCEGSTLTITLIVMIVNNSVFNNWFFIYL